MPLLHNYATFLRLATAIRPIRPEENNQIAAGTGTAGEGNEPKFTVVTKERGLSFPYKVNE